MLLGIAAASAAITAAILRINRMVGVEGIEPPWPLSERQLYRLPHGLSGLYTPKTFKEHFLQTTRTNRSSVYRDVISEPCPLYPAD